MISALAATYNRTAWHPFLFASLAAKQHELEPCGGTRASAGRATSSAS